jgi:subtilase family serine protease
MYQFETLRKRRRQAEGVRFSWWHALGALWLCLPPGALAQRQSLPGHVPAAAATLQAVGNLQESKALEVLIGLPLRNRETLTNLLNDLYNPASPSFHQYLTPAQFTEQFGPTPADYESVIAFAKASGLVVLQTYANRTLLDVRGSVADIEKAFHVHLRLYQHPTAKRTFYAPDSEPSVDLATPLLGITGLDNFVLPHPQNVRAAKRKPATPRSGSAPSGNYWGNDFRAAYVPGTTLTGTGQTVGLFELDDFYTTDITTYESDAGLPNVPLSRLTVDGYTSGDPGSDNLEVALDIEMSVSMAPGLSGVIVYEGPNEGNVTAPNDILNCMATNDAAKQLSCSWGFGIDCNTVQIFQQFGTQGQSFFLASGDSGAFTGAAPPPSDDPYITVVGGTTLTTSGAGGSWVSEEVWNWYNSDTGTNGSTGGISTTGTIPSWQAPVSMANNQGSTRMRNIPDVALTADNVYVIAHDGSTSSGFEVGGTSCAAPLWAAFTALVNEQGAINQRSSVGFLNPALYALGLGSSYAATFHDITTGNNTNLSSSNKFYAVAGYDLCTGWGTPNGTNLINALAPPATNVSSPPAISTPPSNIVAVAGANAAFQVAATGSPLLSYQWFFDSTNSIPDATNAQLTLPNVQPGQAGSYTVVVSDLGGSIASAPAVLRVLVPPAIVAGGLTVTAGNGFSISVNSVSGLNYSLAYKNLLTDPAWTILPSTTVIGTGGVIPLQDPSPPQAQRFYVVIAN